MTPGDTRIANDDFDPEREPPAWFRDLVWNSLAAGLCPPLPVPFLEDWGRNFLRRRLVRGALNAHGVHVTEKQVRVLSGEHDSGCLWSILWIPFRWIRLFRVLYWILSANRLLQSASSLFLEACMICHAARSGHLKGPLENNDLRGLEDLRHTVEEAQRQLKRNPFEPVFRTALSGSMKTVREFSRVLARKMWQLWRWKRAHGGETSASEEGDTRWSSSTMSWAEQLVRILWSDRDGLNAVERKFEEISGTKAKVASPE